MRVLRKLPVVGMLMVLVVISWSSTARAQNIYVDYYTPQFYMDNLVFYDEGGAPIYYEGDMAYSVPPDYRRYNDLVNHFLNNEDAYYDWFENVGYANLNFRRSPILDYYRPRYYHGHLVYYVGGQPVYYIDGVRHPIPPSDRRYARLMRHFSTHRDAYRRWYRAVGRQYRYYTRPVYTDYYTPMYFDGYLVFYDASGLPYYYRGGRRVFVPRHHHRYSHYVTHYRTHRHNYSKWYNAKGRKHHNYRRSKYYRKRVKATKAPRANSGRADRRRYKRRGHKPTIRPSHTPPPRVEPKRHGRDRPARPDRHDRVDRPKRHDRPAGFDRPKRPDRPDRHPKAKPPRPGHHDRKAKDRDRDRGKAKGKDKGKDKRKRKKR